MKKNILLFQLILTAFISLNFFIWHNIFLGLIFGGIFLILNSLAFGRKFLIKLKFRAISLNLFNELLSGFFIILCLLALAGAVFYFFFSLSNTVIMILLILISMLNRKIMLRSVSSERKSLAKIITNINFFNVGVITGYLLLTAFCWLLLFKSRSVEPLLSPWKLLPQIFFICFFLASFLLIYALLKNKKAAGILIYLHYLLFFSIALLIYRLGYGFDPFIHQATERAIADNGEILPKPFYYLGQYSIVVSLSKILQIKISIIDKIYLPMAAAIFLPFFTRVGLASKYEKISPLAPLFILLLPGLPFINSTPYGFSSLLSLIIIFLSLGYFEQEKTGNLMLFGSMAAAAVHPLPGVPIFLFTLFCFARKRKMIKSMILLLILSSIIVPLMFALSAGTGFTFNFNKNFDFSSFINLQRQYDFVLDMIYFYGFNYYWILILLSGLGAFYLIRKSIFKRAYSYIIFFSLYFLNFLVMRSFANFSSLISYENSVFSQRILDFSLYFLMPFLVMILLEVSQRINSLKKLQRLFWVFILSLFLTYSFYLSYPRSDNYQAERGYNTSAYDFKAVQEINSRAGQEKYIVLSPQTTAAAALEQFGFEKNMYYNGYFYYSIPTGGDLYQIYLNIIDGKNLSENIALARELTKVSKIFLVVPDYWWQSGKTVDKATKEAAWSHNIQNKIYIFEY